MPEHPSICPPEVAMEMQRMQSAMAQVVTPFTDEAVVTQLAASMYFKIHPIFRRPRWPDVDDVTMLRIGPALVLASQFLTCSASLHFIHAFIYGTKSKTLSLEKTPVRIDTSFHGLFPDPSQPLPFIEEQKVRSALVELSEHLHFRFGVPHSDGCDGMAISDPQQDRICLGRRGTKSHILISLTALYDLDFMSPPHHALYRRWVHLAVTLVHEVQHALHHALHGTGPAEMIFMDQNIAEMGWAWEAAVLGGGVRIEDRHSGAETLLIQKILGTHERHDQEDQRTHVSPDWGEIVWEIEGESLKNLFSDTFWMGK